MVERMNDEELKALLANEIRTALTYDDTELSSKRARALEYYRGTMDDTPSMVGRSSVVSKDVADTIGWMLPGIIRVFTASDRMAIYEPEKENDEPFAKQATDYINYVFMRDNPGYRILWDATHDSLLLGNGVVKHWWDPKEEIDVTEHTGITAEQIAIIQSDQYAEIIGQRQGEPQMVADPTGQTPGMQVQTFDIKVKRVKNCGRLRIDCIESEDFLIDREAVTIEKARFVAHRNSVSRSDLIKMGFDRDIVDSLPVDRFNTIQEEKIARDDDVRHQFNMVGDESMLLVELYECYVKADVDGDGMAETVRAYFAGAGGNGELLDWEVWDDDVPFSDIPCEPIPHKWDARSIYDDTGDIQRIKTVLTRQFLDNQYWVNNPMTFAEEGSVTNPETLRSPRFGATVWLKKGASIPPTPLPVPYIGDKVLMGLQHFDNVREMRTGVSRATMALDPEALQNQTATANQNQKDSAYSQIELIARNQAELGWRRVFQQMLKLIVKHQDRPRTIRLRDTWVEMDPRSWNANMDVTINIGLGTGSRDRDMAMLNQILTIQIAMTDRLGQSGFGEQALEMVPKINDTAIKLSEAAGIKNPEQFWLDIKPEVLDQMKQSMGQRQDPEMQKAQMKMQADNEKAKGDLAIQHEKMQGDQQLQAGKIQGDQQVALQNMAQQHELKMLQLKAELELKREQLVAELQLKRELAYADLSVKREVGMAAAKAKVNEGGFGSDEGGPSSEVELGGNPG